MNGGCLRDTKNKEEEERPYLQRKSSMMPSSVLEKGNRKLLRSHCGIKLNPCRVARRNEFSGGYQSKP